VTIENIFTRDFLRQFVPGRFHFAGFYRATFWTPLSMSIALFVPLQLPLSPIRVLAIGVGHALDVAVEALSNPIRACITGPRPSAAMELSGFALAASRRRHRKKPQLPARRRFHRIDGRGRRRWIRRRPLIARNAWPRHLQPQPILRDCEDDRIPSAIGNAIRSLT
jgi:hypothetical protein